MKSKRLVYSTYLATILTLLLTLTCGTSSWAGVFIKGLHLKEIEHKSTEDNQILVTMANSSSKIAPECVIDASANGSFLGSQLVEGIEPRSTKTISVLLPSGLNNLDEITISASLSPVGTVPQDTQIDSCRRKTRYISIRKTTAKGEQFVVKYSVEPPVHQWIAYQAWVFLSGDAEQELRDYLPTTSSSTFYSASFSPPSSWTQNDNSPGQQGSEIIEGCWEADNGARPREHFWNPDGSYNDGIIGFRSALQVGQDAWSNALTSYTSGDKSTAYYWLGRCAHVLVDMSVPAHTLLDEHLTDGDAFEDFMETHYREVQAGSRNSSPPDLASLSQFPRSTPSSFNREVTTLFYNLARFSNDFDSDDANGKSSQFGQGQFRHAYNSLRGGIVDSVEWRNLLGGLIRDLQEGSDYSLFDCYPDYNERIYYYGTFFSEANNVPSTIRVNYRTGSPDNFNNWSEISRVQNGVLDCDYKPELPTRAIGYVATLYELFWDTVPHSSSPSNDDFSDRITVTGSSGQTSGSNVNATKESGEPNHAGNSGGASVWWTWTPSSSSEATIDTNGSSFDTTLAVYTGHSVSALDEVESDDDGGDGNRSEVVFQAISGTSYKIAVDGYGGATGDIVLNWDLEEPSGPSNDDFSDRVTLTGSSGQTTGSNVNGTKESGEPNHAGNSGGASVWWTWTPSSSSEATIDTNGSSFDTTLAVYTGPSVSALDEVESDDDGGDGNRSEVVFEAISGTSYKIAVDGYGGATGDIVLNWELTEQCTPHSAPTSISYPESDSDGQYTVSWTQSVGATGYDVIRSSDGGNTWRDWYAGPDLSNAENVGPGTYRYAVVACGDCGCSTSYRYGDHDCVVETSIACSQDSYEPDNTCAQAPLISNHHSIYPLGDVDWVYFDVGLQSRVVIGTENIQTVGNCTGSDTEICLYSNCSGAPIECNDDQDGSLLSKIERTLSPGRYYVKAFEHGNDQTIGGYDLSVVISALPTVTVTAPDTTSSESGGTGYYRISRTGSTSSSLDVYYTMTGSASSSDYSLNDPSPARIAAGASYVDVTLTPVNDSAVEGTEQATLAISTNSAYNRGDPYIATISILDNDASLSVSSFAIEDGVGSTSDRTASFTYSTAGGLPTNYMVSESPTFAGAEWRRHGEFNPPWTTLSCGTGTKTLYLKVQNAAGESSPVSDTIDLIDTCVTANSSTIGGSWPVGVLRNEVWRNQCADEVGQVLLFRGNWFVSYGPVVNYGVDNEWWPPHNIELGNAHWLKIITKSGEVGCSCDFEITRPVNVVEILEPNRNSKWIPGQEYTVRWNDKRPTGGEVKFQIHESIQGFWEGVTTCCETSRPGMNSVSWTLPATTDGRWLTTDFQFGNRVHVFKMYAQNAMGDILFESFSEPFAFVTSETAIEVTSPISGTRWPIGTTRTISWNSRGDVGPLVDILLFREETANDPVWQSVWFNGVPNNGSFNWFIDRNVLGDPLVPGSNYRIKVLKAGDDTVHGWSGFFELLPRSKELDGAILSGLEDIGPHELLEFLRRRKDAKGAGTIGTSDLLEMSLRWSP